MRAVLRQSACLRARARQGETKRKGAQRMKKGSLRLMYLGALCAALLLVGALPALADGTGISGWMKSISRTSYFANMWRKTPIRTATAS